MNKFVLILYSRKGCCLCEGLEQKLKKISLNELNPSLKLRIIDIDEDNISEYDRSRYNLAVPVMVLQSLEREIMIELPRVSPRLNQDGLFNWLQKSLGNSLELD